MQNGLCTTPGPGVLSGLWASFRPCQHADVLAALLFVRRSSCAHVSIHHVGHLGMLLAALGVLQAALRLFGVLCMSFCSWLPDVEKPGPARCLIIIVLSSSHRLARMLAPPFDVVIKHCTPPPRAGGVVAVARALCESRVCITAPSAPV